VAKNISLLSVLHVYQSAVLYPSDSAVHDQVPFHPLQTSLLQCPTEKNQTIGVYKKCRSVEMHSTNINTFKTLFLPIIVAKTGKSWLKQHTTVK